MREGSSVVERLPSGYRERFRQKPNTRGVQRGFRKGLGSRGS